MATAILLDKTLAKTGSALTSASRIGPAQDARREDTDIFIHPSRLSRDVFITHFHELITATWLCRQPGHTVCFADGQNHHIMTDNDTLTWACEMVAGRATVNQPPSALLERWTGCTPCPAPDCGPLSPADDDSASLHTLSTHSEDSSSISGSDNSSSHWIDLALVPGIEGLGSHSGRAVETLGRLIICGISAADRLYRMLRLRGLTFTLRLVQERMERRRALHAILQRFVAPGRQLSGLFDDILEAASMSPTPRLKSTSDFRLSRAERNTAKFDFWTVRMLGEALDRDRRPLSTYSRMKWLAISSINPGLVVHDAECSTRASAIMSLFSGDFEHESEAVEIICRRMRRRRAMTSSARRGHVVDARELLDKLVLAQEGEQRTGSTHAQSDVLWTQVTNIGRICTVVSGCEDADMEEALSWLLDIDACDPHALIDADPSSDGSLWKAACDALARSSRTLQAFDTLSPFWLYDFLPMVARVPPARLAVLQSTGALVPLVETARPGVWKHLVANKVDLGLSNDAGAGVRDGTPVSAASLRARALQLARGFV